MKTSIVHGCFAASLLFLFNPLSVSVCAADEAAAASQADALVASVDQGNTIELQGLVVTATRSEVPLRQVASSVTVIDAAEIARRQKTTVTELLRTVPGLDVVASGGPGGSVSVFARGTNSNHMLVLVDGIEMSDPSNPTGQFDYSALLVDDIDRIEVVRGPQSTLYGSDAIGGVIQIITKRGAGKPGGSIQAEAGSFGTTDTHGQYHGLNGSLRYGLGFALQDTDGISAADAANGNHEKDAYRNTTVNGYLKWLANDKTTVDFNVRHIDSKTDIDDFQGVPPFAFADDTDDRLKNQELFARLQGSFNLYDGFWKQRLGFSYTDYQRNAQNGSAPANTFPSDTDFNGRRYKLDWLHDFQLNPRELFTLGLESEQEKADTFDRQTHTHTIDDVSARNNAVFMQDQLAATDRFSLVAGLRYDHHNDFGGQSTGRIAPVYLLPDTGTRLKASYGTGFKAPSLDQLFDPFFGNRKLKPERSDGWDAGIEQPFLDERLNVDLTYFDNHIHNLVGFDSTFHNINIDKARTSGWELTTRARLTDAMHLNLNYTRLHAVDETTGDELLRRARDKASATLDYRFQNAATLDLSARYVGKRKDFLSAGVGNLPGYSVTDIAFGWPLRPEWTLIGRVENVFDKEYEEVFGFGTPGRAYYAGVKFAPAGGI